MPTQILFIQGAGETTHDQWDNKLVDSLATRTRRGLCHPLSPHAR